MDNKINIKNKRAYFDYEILEKFVAGMVLSGTEIKSIRMGKASLSDSYCLIHENEMYVKGLQITEYQYGSYNNHEPSRDKKLLLERSEIRRLARKTRESGNTIIVLRLFISGNGYAKIEIALAKGKKNYDKRESLKQKDAKRQMDRSKKSS
jgi:SsrA-binding protein